MSFNGLKVFSATKARDRQVLGERVTEWLRCNTQCEIVDKCVKQSSDNEYHCLSVTLFYRNKNQAMSAEQ